MTDETLYMIAGDWFDSGGYIDEEGARFPIFVADGRATDEYGYPWTVDAECNLVSHISGAYFSPAAGELIRVGLAAEQAV